MYNPKIFVVISSLFKISASLLSAKREKILMYFDQVSEPYGPPPQSSHGMSAGEGLLYNGTLGNRPVCSYVTVCH